MHNPSVDLCIYSFSQINPPKNRNMTSYGKYGSIDDCCIWSAPNQDFSSSALKKPQTRFLFSSHPTPNHNHERQRCYHYRGRFRRQQQSLASKANFGCEGETSYQLLFHRPQEGQGQALQRIPSYGLRSHLPQTYWRGIRQCLCRLYQRQVQGGPDLQGHSQGSQGRTSGIGSSWAANPISNLITLSKLPVPFVSIDDINNQVFEVTLNSLTSEADGIQQEFLNSIPDQLSEIVPAVLSVFN